MTSPTPPEKKVDEKTFTGILKCADCGHELNRAENVPEGDKLRCEISAPLVAGRCPKGCRSTFSDCNMNAKIEWIENRSKP